jgi:hypothetical protein
MKGESKGAGVKSGLSEQSGFRADKSAAGQNVNSTTQRPKAEKIEKAGSGKC